MVGQTELHTAWQRSLVGILNLDTTPPGYHPTGLPWDHHTLADLLFADAEAPEPPLKFGIRFLAARVRRSSQ